MQPFEFIKYEQVSNEKHLGIATVRLYGKVILRYKIVPNKDGNGWFPCPASYKMSSDNGSPDRYLQAFFLDSNSDKEVLEDLIRANVKRFMATIHSTVLQSNACTGSPAIQAPQPNPIYQPPTQQSYEVPASTADSIHEQDQLPF